MGQDTSFFLNYSIHAIFILFLAFIFISYYQRKYQKWSYTILGVLCILFIKTQINSIIESETTLRIISHTKLNISYILFFITTIMVAFFPKKIHLFIWLILGIQSILYYLSFNLTGVGFNESIPFHLKSGIDGAGVGDFYKLIIDFCFVVVLFIIVGYFYFKFLVKKYNSIKTLKSQILTTIIGLGVIFNPLNYDIYETYRVIDEDPKFLFKDHYYPPKEVLKSDKKYNLVWIYAEAFERIYLNQEIFPDLAPNLAQLEKESVSFSNVHQVWGTGWTIAGIVSSQTGIPLYAVGRQNNDLNRLPHFLPKIKGIGNILTGDGYHNVFIQGSPKAFAGNDKFLKSHGFQLFAFEDIAPKYKSKQNLSRWGLNDDKTLEFAKDKYKELKAKNQPFSLMVSTINTHSPIGFIPPKYKDKKYKDGRNITLNAFYVSDLLISKFIKEIKAMDTEKNTIIVISSDHLTMRNMVSNILEKHPDLRKNLFMVYFPEKIKPQLINKNASPIDEGVTILDMMGYPVQRLGLGVSLMSNEQTLKEKSQNRMDNVLKSWKKYYFQFW